MMKTVLAAVGTVSALLGYSVSCKVKETNQDLAIEETDKSPDFKLKLVQIAFRHGARTPLSSPDYLPKVKYHDDLLKHGEHTYVPYHAKGCDGNHVDISTFIYKHKDTTYGEMNHGELTSKGADQMHQLGSCLKNCYINEMKFLSPDHTEDVYVRSTSVKRAIESARCTLAGLYPNQNTSIPIHISKLDSEVLFPNFSRCAYLSSLTRWAWFFPDLIHGLKDERVEIQSALGIPEDADVHIVTLRDNLHAHDFHGLLPEELSDPTVLERADRAAMKIMDHVFAGSEHTRETALKLGIGPLLKTFLDNIDASIEGKSSIKMCLFSGHDTTLMPLLHALDIHDSNWTPYAASIILELYEKPADKERKDHFVRVLYEHKEQLIPGCDAVMCPMEQFRKVVSKYIMDDKEYHEKCSVKHDSMLASLPTHKKPVS